MLNVLAVWQNFYVRCHYFIDLFVKFKSLQVKPYIINNINLSFYF